MEATAAPAQQNRLPRVFLARFLLVALGYGINGAVIVGIPFLFYHAPLQCLDKDGNSFTCSKQEACDNPFGYVEASDYPQILSITSQLNFHCDRRVLEATIQTLGQFGRSFGYVILLLFPVPLHRKENLLYTFLLISGIALCSLGFISSTEMFGLSLFTANLMFSLFYGLLYSYISDSSPAWFAKMGAAYVNVAWPFLMIFMIALSYFFCSWQNILIHFTGIPFVVLGISGFVLRNYIKNNAECQRFIKEEIEKDKPPYENPDETSFDLLKQNYQAMKTNKVLRKNVLIWTLGWGCNGLCFFGCYISLNTLKGDLYFNNMSSSIFELCSSLLAVVIVQRLNLRKVIINTYYIIGFCFCSCIFKGNSASQTDQGISQFALFIDLLPVIIAKVSYEMMWTVMIQYAPKIIQRKYGQAQFTFSSTMGMAITNMIPFYNYLMESIGVSPFIGYGVFCLVAGHYSRQFVEINEDGEEADAESKTHPLLDGVELEMLCKQTFNLFVIKLNLSIL